MRLIKVTSNQPLEFAGTPTGAKKGWAKRAHKTQAQENLPANLKKAVKRYSVGGVRVRLAIAGTKVQMGKGALTSKAINSYGRLRKIERQLSDAF